MVSLDDGGVMAVDRVDPPEWTPETPIVIVAHGLNGGSHARIRPLSIIHAQLAYLSLSASAPLTTAVYVQHLLKEVLAAGWRGMALNNRGIRPPPPPQVCVHRPLSTSAVRLC